MRKFFIVAVLSVFIVFIGVTRVYAVGLGPYIELGSGSGDWERDSNVRFWLGPQIRLAYYTGDRDDVDLKLFVFGIGPVLGVNFPMGPVATMSLSGGFRILGYAGQEEYTYYDSYYTSYQDSTSDITITGGMAFFNVSVLFGR